MARTEKKKDVVIVGLGWTGSIPGAVAGIVAGEPMAAGGR